MSKRSNGLDSRDMYKKWFGSYLCYREIGQEDHLDRMKYTESIAEELSSVS